MTQKQKEALIEAKASYLKAIEDTKNMDVVDAHLYLERIYMDLGLCFYMDNNYSKYDWYFIIQQEMIRINRYSDYYLSNSSPQNKFTIKEIIDSLQYRVDFINQILE